MSAYLYGSVCFCLSVSVCLCVSVRYESRESSSVVEKEKEKEISRLVEVFGVWVWGVKFYHTHFFLITTPVSESAFDMTGSGTL